MTEDAAPQNDPDQRDMNIIYAQTGYSFPMGPVIPSPDATRQPLFPGLVKPGLNRPKALRR